MHGSRVPCVTRCCCACARCFACARSCRRRRCRRCCRCPTHIYVRTCMYTTHLRTKSRCAEVVMEFALNIFYVHVHVYANVNCSPIRRKPCDVCACVVRYLYTIATVNSTSPSPSSAATSPPSSHRTHKHAHTNTPHTFARMPDFTYACDSCTYMRNTRKHARTHACSHTRIHACTYVRTQRCVRNVLRPLARKIM